MTYEADSGTTARQPPRRRKRNGLSDDERKKVGSRVSKLYNDEWTNRANAREARLQRMAKYRLWRGGTDWPWASASDIAIPDMLQDSLRIQDTLVNAVMSQRPPVVSRANNNADAAKQSTVDQLLNFQFFVENTGEEIIGEMAEAFVNDPSMTIFTPWVREERSVAEVMLYDEIPEDAQPKDYFFSLVRAAFPGASRFEPAAGGWDWTVTDAKGEEATVCFYTDRDEQVEMVIERDAIAFDAPRPFVKDYDDVLFPARSANLQSPCPSNPNGAPYVILRDKPTVAEIRSLVNSGFYDLMTKADMEGIVAKASPNTNNAKEEAASQKDVLSGTNETPTKPLDDDHKRLTRLTCFDIYDLDGDGVAEDVIFWVIEETRTVLKARLLIDMYPGNPPRRPLDGGSFLPVGGRYDGMSLLEIMEPMHDAIKVIVDQAINANDLAIASPGFYRPSGGMNPEVLRIEPFTLSPLQNPQQDVVFPSIGNPNAMGAAMNMITTMGSWQDKLTMVTDLQMGAIPPGSSSAFRTIGTMSLAMGQGEARPERILRRFFIGLTGVWSQMHRLNQSFLPKDKQFRISGVVLPGADPYIKVKTASQITGNFQFDFDANVLNTSKASLQQALEKLMVTYINPLMLQTGVVTPDNIYRMALDYGRAYGQNVDAYISPPTPAAAKPRLLAEDAILQIMSSQMPFGEPAEPGGIGDHLQKLMDFMQSDNFGLLTADQVAIFRTYIQHLGLLAQQQAQQQQLQANAAQFQQGRAGGGGQPGAPPTNPQAPPTSAPMISGPNEMLNEALPTAGGGANANRTVQ